MPSHSQAEFLPYSIQQMYALVADVASYPEFLPWCVAARISEKSEKGFLAELVIRYHGLSESYTSDVKLTPPEGVGEARVEATMIRGPFHHLVNLWVFTPENKGTRVEFFINFQFKSPLLEKLMGGFFDRATHKMVESFRKRAENLYKER